MYALITQCALIYALIVESLPSRLAPRLLLLRSFSAHTHSHTVLGFCASTRTLAHPRTFTFVFFESCPLRLRPPILFHPHISTPRTLHRHRRTSPRTPLVVTTARRTGIISLSRHLIFFPLLSLRCGCLERARGAYNTRDRGAGAGKVHVAHMHDLIPWCGLQASASCKRFSIPREIHRTFRGVAKCCLLC